LKSPAPLAQESNVDRNLAGLVLGLGGLFTVWQWFTFGAPFGGDWAQYMSHARALVEGAEYGDIGYLFSPYAWVQGPPVYPPGLPVMLAPSVAITGQSLVLPRLLMHGLLALFLVSVFRYFARSGNPNLALGTVAMLAASFLLANAPNIVGSDLGMCAFVWGVLVLADGKTPWSGRRALLIGLCGFLAINLRVAAAPLIPAVLLWGLLHRRGIGRSPWLLAVVWAVALGVVLTMFGPGEQAASSRTVPISSDVSQFDRWLGRVMRRITTYRFAISEAYLYPSPVGVLNKLYHVVALPISAFGLWVWMRMGWRSLGVIFALGTAAMLAILPVWVGRYAWVVTPFICYGLLRGLSALWARSVGGGAGPQVACGFALVVGILAATFQVGAPASVQDDAEYWQAAGQALLAEGVDAERLRVASNRPRVFTWHTRIPAAALPNADVDRFLLEAQRLGVSRVVLSTQQESEFVYRLWGQWREARPDAFEAMGEFGTLEVYRLVFTPVE